MLGNGIRTEPEKKAGKEVTIKLPAAVAKENNCGSINSAQKAGRTAKTALKPRGKPGPKPKPSTKRTQTETEVETPKPREKPGPKPSTKRKRTETEIETPSPRKLRKRA